MFRLRWSGPYMFACHKVPFLMLLIICARPSEMCAKILHMTENAFSLEVTHNALWQAPNYFISCVECENFCMSLLKLYSVLNLSSMLIFLCLRTLVISYRGLIARLLQVRWLFFPILNLLTMKALWRLQHFFL